MRHLDIILKAAKKDPDIKITYEGGGVFKTYKKIEDTECITTYIFDKDGNLKHIL